jgi:hypothetical protein
MGGIERMIPKSVERFLDKIMRQGKRAPVNAG